MAGETGCVGRSGAAHTWRLEEGGESVGGRTSPREGGQSLDCLPEPTGAVQMGSLIHLVLMMERSLSNQRAGAEQRRDAAEKCQEQKEQRSVAAIRKEADDTFKGALTSGLITMSGGAMQLVGVGLKSHAGGLEEKASSLKTQAAEARMRAQSAADAAVKASAESAAEAATKAAKSLSGAAKTAAVAGEVLSATKGVFDGLGKGVDGFFQGSAKEHQADQAAHTSAAQAAGREARRADEMANELGELRQKSLARLEQLVDSEHQSRLALIQRM